MTETYLTRDTLLSRLKNGNDEHSWEEFVANYGYFIYSVLNTLKVPEVYIDDLYQQINLKIWNSIDQFDRKQQKGSFRNWIYTISKNTALNQIKKEQAIIHHQETILLNQDPQHQQPDIHRLIEENWNKHISRLAFENISKKVSSRAMEAFTAQFEDETTEETAKRLGYDIKTLYIYRGRIKRKLIEEIKNLKDLLE